MGKRSNFERIDRDFYKTPREAVVPLFRFLEEGSSFTEPCVGEGDLIRILEEEGFRCLDSYDYEEDATKSQRGEGDYFITNPPWDRKILHPLIDNLRKQRKTWLLFDADWPHTRQSSELMKYCKMIVSVGRVKWFPDSKMVGKDNCCWYLFVDEEVETRFVGR